MELIFRKLSLGSEKSRYSFVSVFMEKILVLCLTFSSMGRASNYRQFLKNSTHWTFEYIILVFIPNSVYGEIIFLHP